MSTLGQSSIPSPTSTWGPLPTILPTVIPANLPRPTGYPPQLPRTSTGMRVVEPLGWPTGKQVDASANVVRARVARINPPFWTTLDGMRLAIITDQSIGTPALLTVTHVYKGPAMASIEVSLIGARFSSSECTSLPLAKTRLSSSTGRCPSMRRCQPWKASFASPQAQTTNSSVSPPAGPTGLVRVSVVESKRHE